MLILAFSIQYVGDYYEGLFFSPDSKINLKSFYWIYLSNEVQIRIAKKKDLTVTGSAIHLEILPFSALGRNPFSLSFSVLQMCFIHLHILFLFWFNGFFILCLFFIFFFHFFHVLFFCIITQRTNCWHKKVQINNMDIPWNSVWKCVMLAINLVLKRIRQFHGELSDINSSHQYITKTLFLSECILNAIHLNSSSNRRILNICSTSGLIIHI